MSNDPITPAGPPAGPPSNRRWWWLAGVAALVIAVGVVLVLLLRDDTTQTSTAGSVAPPATTAAPSTTGAPRTTGAPSTTAAPSTAGPAQAVPPPACTAQGLLAGQNLDRRFSVESFGCSGRIVTAAGVPTSAFAWAVMRSQPYVEDGATVTPAPMLLYFSDTDSNGNPQGHWLMEAYVLADPSSPAEGGGWQACDALLPNAGCEALVAAGLDPALAGR